MPVKDVLVKKRTKLLLPALLLLLLLAFLGGFFLQGRLYHTVPAITGELLGGELRSITEYASLEYCYTNVGKFEDRVDFYGWKVPLTTKSFIVTYDGVMKLGIRSKDIGVTVRGKEVHLQLPPAQILSHEIREDTLEVLDQTRNIFNPIQIEDYTAFAADRKGEMAKKARELGLFDRAREQAGEQLRQALEVFLGDTYTISIEP